MKRNKILPVCFKILIILFIACSISAKTLTILVHPFQNTGEVKYLWISSGMTYSVISDLMKISDITVISEMERKKAIKEIQFSMTGLVDERKSVKAGKMLGADVIFTGNYLVSGNKIRVNANLMDVIKGSIEKSVKLDGTINEIFDLQDKIVFALMAETNKIPIADVKPVKIDEESRKKIEKTERPELSAYELYSMGLQIQDTNPRGALDYFNRAIQVSPDYFDALIQAGFTSGDTLNLFDEALSYFKRADDLFKKRKLQNTDGYSVLMMYIGSVYVVKGQLDKALEFYSKSQGIKDKLGLQITAGYSDLIMNIGHVYREKGQLDKALEFYFKSQAIRDRLGLQNTVYYSDLMTNIGIVYTYKEQLDKALEFYFKSQAIRDRLGLQNTARYSELIMSIGVVYVEKKQHDKALDFYLKSQGIRDSLGLQNTDGYSVLMINIGVVYVVKGQLDKALEFYSKSLGIKDKLGLQNTAGYGFLLNNLASLYEEKGKDDLAGEYYRKAYKTFIKADYSGPEKDQALKCAERLGK